MQINQPFDFGLGIFQIVAGVFLFWVGSYRMRNPLPQIQGWWFVLMGPVFGLAGLARIFASLDLPRRPSGRTLYADGAALLAALLVLAFILPSARRMWKTRRQGWDRPAV